MLVVHLRMSGRLLLLDKTKLAKKKPKFLRVKITMQSGQLLIFEDMRVFGRLYYVLSLSELERVVPSFGSLGIEPLEKIKAEQLTECLSKRRQAIKTALLDQSLIAGIGNIYADEILFETGIHPLTKASSITSEQIKLLTSTIPKVLEQAINHGGSSIKDFVDSDGVNGNYQHKALVYGRDGKPCHRCRSIIERIKISGRSAHFCSLCQNYCP